MTKLFMDIETSDLSPHNGVLLQFGYVLEKDDDYYEENEFILKKDIIVSAKTTELTGLTQSDIDNGIDPNIGFGRIMSLIEKSDILIGHNLIKFDAPFIATRMATRDFHINNDKKRIKIDTAALFKAVNGRYNPMPNETLWDFQNRILDMRIYGLYFNLDLAMRHFKIEVKEGEERHTALADIRYTKLVYEKLKELPQFKQFDLP